MLRLCSSLILLAIVLSACNLNRPDVPDLTPDENNVIYITATPEPITGPPTATPPPTIAPTATTPPETLMAQGDQQLVNGEYQAALGVYQQVLLQGDAAPAEQRAEAAIKAGQAALRDGLFDAAVEVLSGLIEALPNDPRAAQAYFLRGDAQLGLALWDAAIADFEQYLALRPGLIDSYAYERIGDAHLALARSDSAIAAYDQALAARRSLVPELILREKVAQIYQNLGRYADAVAQYDAILAVAQNAPYRAQMDFLAAQALISSGDIDNGLPRMRRVFDTYIETPTAYEAMQVLLANSAQINGFLRGGVLYRHGDYQSAIAAFNEFSSTAALTEIPADLYLMLGRAYREIGNPDAAQIAFQTLITQYAGDALFGDALLEQGRTRFLSGDIPAAIETYLSIADRYGYLNDTAAEAMWRAGYLYGTNDNTALSRQVFTQLANDYPNTEWAANGLFLAASAALSGQEWAVAENLYNRIAAIATGEDQAAAYLWVARLAIQQNNQAAAVETLGLAEAAAPDSYYAARAADLRVGRQPFQRPASYRFEFDEAADRAAAEEWLRGRLGIEQAGELWRMPVELMDDPRRVRGGELWMVGAHHEALDEFTAVLDESRENKDALTAYRMAVHLRGLGAYRSSIVAAADVIRITNAGTLEVPAYIARMRYPIYYQDLIIPEADAYGIDPLLMFALIRQESLFDAGAVSVANAMGLMQVIPSTGQYIANQLNRADYRDSDLLQPGTAVAFGSYYLDEQLRLFEGFVPAALAAYNAGPGRALDWLALSGRDTDQFITTITIDETNRYVQQIYSHYNLYRDLYGAS